MRKLRSKRNKIPYHNFYDQIQLESIASVLMEDDLYFYRKICRWYSKTFHTPLLQVYKESWVHILRCYYEEKFESIPYNNLLDLAMESYTPELNQSEDEKLDSLIKDLEKEQERTVLKKQGKQQSFINKTPISNSDSKQSQQQPQKELAEINQSFDDEEID